MSDERQNEQDAPTLARDAWYMVHEAHAKQQDVRVTLHGRAIEGQVIEITGQTFTVRGGGQVIGVWFETNPHVEVVDAGEMQQVRCPHCNGRGSCTVEQAHAYAQQVSTLS